MGSNTLARARVARWPLIAAIAVAVLSVMSAVALMATIAWTSVGYRMTSTDRYVDRVTELVSIDHTVAAEFDVQSGKYLYTYLYSYMIKKIIIHFEPCGLRKKIKYKHLQI